MDIEEDAATALTLAMKAIKLHLDKGFSLKSGLYQVSRELNPSVSVLRLARKLLHIYAIYRKNAAKLTDVLPGLSISKDGRILLELLFSSILRGLNLGSPERLARALRRSPLQIHVEEIEPWLGLMRSIKLLEIPEEETHPTWFINLLHKIIGRGEASIMLRFQDRVKPPLYITINDLHISEEEVLRRLEEGGVKFSSDKRLKGIYVLEEVKRSKRLIDLSRKGLLFIHDFSSYYAVHSMDLTPGEVVLDVCAAPGTKTVLMAVKMRDKGRIVSIDLGRERLKSHLKRVRRAGIRIVDDLQADATAPLPLNLMADKVLVDPPCSSTGLFWREPIYRWTIKPRHIRMFARIQFKILENSARHVKKGGVLLYSTCSISLEENEFVIEDFLKMHSEFELEEVYPEIGSRGLRGLSEARRLYPHRDMCNGFFLAKLVRLF